MSDKDKKPLSPEWEKLVRSGQVSEEVARLGQMQREEWVAQKDRKAAGIPEFPPEYQALRDEIERYQNFCRGEDVGLNRKLYTLDGLVGQCKDPKKYNTRLQKARMWWEEYKIDHFECVQALKDDDSE